ASKITMILSAATDFENSRNTNWKSIISPLEKNKIVLQKASKIGYESLLQRHIKDYKQLYDNMEIKLGGDTLLKGYTTESLLKDYKVHRSSYVEALLFQYGRYLLISSSRVGGLPA